MKTILCVGMLCASYLIVGTMDYNDKVAAAEEKKQSPERARIWSKKCEKQDKRVLATKADSGPWKIICIDGRGKEVKA